MDLFFKCCAAGLMMFTAWIVWVFCKEWDTLYKNKEK